MEAGEGEKAFFSCILFGEGKGDDDDADDGEGAVW